MQTADVAASPFIAGVVLAAGTASRMGQPKQLLSLGDRCLLQHVLDEAAASCVAELILVLGHRADEIRAAIRLPSRLPARIVVNPDYAQGLSTSLRLGLRSANPRATAVAILLGDQPHVSAALIDRVAAAFRAAGSQLARPVHSDPAGHRVPGHPVFLTRHVWAEVEKLRGDQGARDLLFARPDWLLEVLVEGEPPADLDTWEEYQRAVDAGQTRC